MILFSYNYGLGQKGLNFGLEFKRNISKDNFKQEIVPYNPACPLCSWNQQVFINSANTFALGILSEYGFNNSITIGTGLKLYFGNIDLALPDQFPVTNFPDLSYNTWEIPMYVTTKFPIAIDKETYYGIYLKSRIGVSLVIPSIIMRGRPKVIMGDTITNTQFWSNRLFRSDFIPSINAAISVEYSFRKYERLEIGVSYQHQLVQNPIIFHTEDTGDLLILFGPQIKVSNFNAFVRYYLPFRFFNPQSK